MAIKDFFRKIGRGIKKAGRFIKDKVFPTVGRLAKPVLGLISHAPGIIGTVGRIGSGIANILTGATQHIPNEEARKKLKDVIDSGNNRFQHVVDTGQNYAQAGQNIVESIKNNPNTSQLINHFKQLPVDFKSKIGPK